jgi:hypothetical protein
MTENTSVAPLIGVLARPDEYDTVREFFELFKTSWEFCRRDRRYQVLLQANGAAAVGDADLVLLYGCEATSFDRECGHLPSAARQNTTVSWDGETLPVYGKTVSFPTVDAGRDVVRADTGEPVTWTKRLGTKTVVRIGYDLFSEIRYLLTTGQPAAYARVPTLERHIAFLRSCILGAGIPVVEIPPVPADHQFIVCLTHDLDHPSIRLHRFDRTTIGFLYRALIGSVIKVFRRRLSFAGLLRNFVAALKLPFIHLGWAEDFWLRFDRYLQLEKGLASTFFVIPIKGEPGRTMNGPASRVRASAYSVSDITEQVRGLVAAGSEVAVHGIDAWLDSDHGSKEREAVARAAGAPVAGVRMHWLFFDEAAPSRLDRAGFDYDSSFGYNQTVGLRAGTMQAFKPLTAQRVLEIPLTIMDTALFYPAHLNLTAGAARQLVCPLVDDAERYGGVLTINWHDRSLAPERLWGGFYAEFLDQLKRRAPWFPTVSDAVSWFHQRRSVVFQSIRCDGRSVHVSASAHHEDHLPGLKLRVYRPHGASRHGGSPGHRADIYTDVTFTKSVDAQVGISAGVADECEHYPATGNGENIARRVDVVEPTA